MVFLPEESFFGSVGVDGFDVTALPDPFKIDRFLPGFDRVPEVDWRLSEFPDPIFVVEEVEPHGDPLVGEIDRVEEGDWLTDGNIAISETIAASLEVAKDRLSHFAASPEFTTKMQVAFGSSAIAGTEISELAQAWSVGEFSSLPPVEVRSRGELKGAIAGFAVATNTIYLSQEFLSANVGNTEAVAGVLLEEIGHAVDARLNFADAPGDEGAIFSALVRGEKIGELALRELKGEDDGAIVVLDGEEVAIEEADIRGTNEDDVLFGTGEDDNIRGERGNDRIFGEGGNDRINSGSGNDSIFGGEGDDRINIVNPRSDDVFANGQAGDDVIWGGDGNDTLLGEDGNDDLSGFEGDDFIDGGAGNDDIGGFAGNDILVGGDGDDTIGSGFGNNVDDDSIDAGNGNDLLFGSRGNDTILGGAGDDRFLGEPLGSESGNDMFNGGEGNDNISSGGGNDILIGGGGADTLRGGDGIDIYDLRIGNAGGSVIQDTEGEMDILTLNPPVSTLSNLTPGVLGMTRFGATSLLLDLNQDGIANPADDVLILDFCQSGPNGPEPGDGFIENIDGMFGIDIFNFVCGSGGGEDPSPGGDPTPPDEDDGDENNDCADTSPLSVELESGVFEDMDGDGDCEGQGTIFIGRTDGILRMLRVENATAEFDDNSLKVTGGTVFSEIGNVEEPLFQGDFEIPFNTATSSSFSETGSLTNEFQLAGLDVNFSSIGLDPSTIRLGSQFLLPEEITGSAIQITLPNVISSSDVDGEIKTDALLIGTNGPSLGASGKVNFPDPPGYRLFNLLDVNASDLSLEYSQPEDAV